MSNPLLTLIQPDKLAATNIIFLKIYVRINKYNIKKIEISALFISDEIITKSKMIFFRIFSTILLSIGFYIQKSKYFYKLNTSMKRAHQ